MSYRWCSVEADQRAGGEEKETKPTVGTESVKREGVGRGSTGRGMDLCREKGIPASKKQIFEKRGKYGPTKIYKKSSTSARPGPVQLGRAADELVSRPVPTWLKRKGERPAIKEECGEPDRRKGLRGPVLRYWSPSRCEAKKN